MNWNRNFCHPEPIACHPEPVEGSPRSKLRSVRSFVALKMTAFVILFLLPAVTFAQERFQAPDAGLAPEGVSRPMIMLLVLAGLVLLPIVAMMTTSFVKLVVVTSMLRNALGTQQIPPTPVITGLALILTIYIMAPVGMEMYRAAQTTIQRDSQEPLLSQTSVNLLLDAISKAKEPMRAFLKRHSHVKEQKLFYSIGQVLMSEKSPEDVDEDAPLPSATPEGAPEGAIVPPEAGEPKPEKKTGLQPDDFMVLVPAFTISELTEAFQIAFIIFLPFLVIDIVVTNILLALGMFMVPPVTMSLPIKLLLFVMVDGWHILTRALITGYM